MSSDPDAFRASRYLAVRFWPTWLLFGVLWLCAQLPLLVQLWLGRRLGDAMYFLHRERRHIARINLALCFPEKSAEQRHDLLRQAFQGFGMGLSEMASLWFRRREFLSRHCEIDGIEHLHEAQRRGAGVIVLPAHFTTLEVGGTVLAGVMPLSAFYDPPKNPLVAAFLLARRKRYLNVIDNHNIRQMVRRLREGGCVWYPPDQHVGEGGSSVVSQFFGHEVLSASGTSRMAKMTGAAVIPYLPIRVGNSGRYRLQLLPALADFPSLSSDGDTQRINDILESHIRDYPEQYLWLHKRFKYLDTCGQDRYL